MPIRTRSHLGWLAVGSALSTALLLALANGQPAAAAPPPAPPGVATITATPPPVDRQMGALPSLAPLVKQLRPGVVNIYTTQNVRVPRGFGGPGRDPFEEFFGRQYGGRGSPQDTLKQQALGSGFLIGGGFALTNNHVIDGADEIKVKCADGKEWSAKVVGRDPSTDVALLELLGDGAKNEPGAKLGDSDEMEVGDYVVAIGNPFGLQLTVTSGIISATGRVIGAGPYDDFLQTDASINPGNSGGPLFNLKGEVVGINTAIIARGQGIGFAVPINMVKPLLSQLKDHGRVSRGWLGISMQELTPPLATALRVPEGRGALVAQVLPAGPAEQAGLREGDVVVEFNGKGVDAPGALTRLVGATTPGSSSSLKVLRDGKEFTLTLRVGERPDETAATPGRKPDSAEPSGHITVGLAVEPLTAERARRLGLSENSGVVVVDLAPGGAAEAAGVQPNDVLIELQKKPTPTPEAYRAIARAVKPGESVMFRVRRGAGLIYLAGQAPVK